MSTRRIVARPSASQRPRRRRQRPGRLDPINGSVTRADIEAIYRDFVRGVDDPTAEEFKTYLLGAIVDWSPSPRQTARMRARARAREAAKRRDQERPQLPLRALAVA